MSGRTARHRRVGVLRRLRLRRWSSGIVTVALIATSVAAFGVVETAKAPPAKAAQVGCTPTAGFTDCQRFTYSGNDQTFTVPAGVHSVSVKAWGAGGGGVDPNYDQQNSGGGGGGYATATVATTPGQALTVVVGGGGKARVSGGAVNGGGPGAAATYGGGGAGGANVHAGAFSDGAGSSGGGMSALFLPGGITAANTLLVAGGGGGASPGADVPCPTSNGSCSVTGASPVAGGGGGTTGGADSVPSISGRGGTAAAGGAGATATAAQDAQGTSGGNCAPEPSNAGAQFAGGAGSDLVASAVGPQLEGGGGGGGGWFGGGGGKCQGRGGATTSKVSVFYNNGSGGGGSSRVTGTGVTGGTTTAGGNGAFAGGSAVGTGGAAANTGDAQYVAGVAAGGGTTSGATSGGDGQVVVQWSTNYTITKTATPASALPGDVVTYSLAIKNTSLNDYTAANPASFSDSLAGVLDDATYNNDASSNVSGWTFSGTGPLTGGGPLLAGATATITYSVTVNNPDAGNKSLVNTVTATGAGGSCTASGCSVTTTVNPPIACAPGTVYGVNATQLLSINNTTGAATTIATFSGVSNQLNAVAVTAGGKNAYAISQGSALTTGSPTIFRYSAATLSTTSYTGTAIVNTLNGSGFLRGGINLANGIYYYSGTRTNGTQDFYAFNTNTNTPIGYIGSLTGFTGGNGDLSFDSAGNMLLVVSNGDATNNTLIRVPNIPTTAGSATLVGTALATLPANVSENGITFDGDGYLYASTGTTLYKLNPNTGALVSQVAFSGAGTITDLADCEVNGSLTLQKNIVSRATSTDQFGLTITGGGVASGNSGTTSGSTTGQQTALTATAGPVIGILGTTYEVKETATSGSLANYTTTLACIDKANGNAPITATPVGGSSTDYTLVFPNPSSSSTPLANILCTMTNTSLPRITLTKALGGNRVNAGDQFTMQIRTGSASGPVVSSGANATTAGSGSTVTGGTGTTGAFVGVAGTTYYLTEAGTGGALLTDYANEAITCTDANGLQSGLPSGAPFSGSLPIQVAAGANISCTLTNTPNAPSLQLTKSALPTTVNSTSDTVAYSFLVKNTGNVTLTGLAIADTFTAPSTGTVPTISCPTQTLAPGDSTTCTGTYPVVASDLDHGVINNSATASAADPSNKVVTSNVSTATVTATQSGALTIVKSASPGTVTTVGQAVAYSFLVKNTGNVTLTGVAVADTFTAPAGPALVIGCPSTTLAAGASMTCTAPYVATAADFDHGRIDNSATASGKTPGNVTVTSPPSTAVVTATSLPAISVQKSASPTTVATVGQSVAYSFLVKNTGNVTLTSVSVADAFTAPAGPALVISCPPTPLAAGATLTCTATYSVKQADLDAGTIVNSATASGTPPTGSPVTSAPSTATVTASQSALLSIQKAASPTTVTSIGQTVAYSFLVTNNGNVTLTGVGVADTFTAPAGPPLTISCPTSTLAPLASTTCTASYVSTAADFDRGRIDNSATASGKTPGNLTVTSAPSTATVTTTQSATITVQKSALPTTVTTVGQSVAYSFLVKNTGNVTLTSVSVADAFTAPAGPALSISCPVTTLAAGASTTCTATYSVKQADLDAGTIVNSATASGTPPTGPPVTSPALDRNRHRRSRRRPDHPEVGQSHDGHLDRPDRGVLVPRHQQRQRHVDRCWGG